MLGAVLKIKGAQLRVLGDDRRERNIPQRRLLGVCGVLSIDGSQDAILEGLSRLKKAILEQSKEIDLPMLWEALVGDLDVVEPEELGLQWFGDDAEPDQIMAVIWAVLQDSLHFKLKGGKIRVQPVATVEQKQRERQLAQRRKEAQQAAVAWIRGGLPPENQELLVGQLKEVALFGSEAPKFGELKPLLRELGRAGDEAHTAFKALVEVKIWTPEENLALQREGVSVEMEPGIVQAANSVLDRGWDSSLRQDWTGRHTFSVDQEKTRDVDDAMSCWEDGARLMVAIHITDVAEFLDPGSELDLDARMRGQSIYLPDRVIPMLSRVLSEQGASLLPKQLRPALTMVFHADPSGVCQDPRFELTLVAVDEKLTYDEVDERLGSNSMFQKLLAFCQAHRQVRREQGALHLPLPEIALVVNEEGEINVSIQPDSPSHELVSELMICFNEQVAKLLSQREIPALYRGQPEPRKRILGETPTLFQSLLQRRQMLRSLLESKPLRHTGLGLEHYTMASSPLRRYLDLCVQRQLKAAVTGCKPVYDAADFEELKPYLALAQRRAQRIQRATERFYMLLYLERLKEPLIQALWFEPYGKREKVILLPFLNEAEVAIKKREPPPPGTLVDLEILDVNARKETLKLGYRSVAKKPKGPSELLAPWLSEKIADG